MIRFSPILLSIVPWCVCFTHAAAQSVEIPLSKPLWEWKREMEGRSSGGSIILTRVFTDPKQNTMSLVPGLAHREVLTRYFRDEAFVAQFYRSHGTTVAYHGFEGTLFFVILNMALADEWKGVEDGVIAHEFGHIDLLTRGYPAWATGQGTGEQCIATQAGDVVQHVLIRDEMKRRNTTYFEYWTRNLEAVVKRMENETSAPDTTSDTCRKAARVAMWSDVRMAFDANTWPRYTRFEELMRKSSPELKSIVDQIESRLREAALWSKDRYMSALYDVFQQVSRIEKPKVSPSATPSIIQ